MKTRKNWRGIPGLGVTRRQARRPRCQAPGALLLGAGLLLAGLAGVAHAAEPAQRVAAAAPSPAPCPALLGRSLPRLQDEKPQNLCQYSGRVLVVVNTASFCGFTPQYRGLEALSRKYESRGLVVLGFPSHDFNQEPAGGQEIAAFCENTYGVRFPMFMKSKVKADPKAATPDPAVNPLYADLARLSGEGPRWNFHKYLVARDGHTVRSYGSRVDPQDPDFVRDVERLLDAK